jgi:RNA polymerase sigma-70 factor (ECF subfamily)
VIPSGRPDILAKQFCGTFIALSAIQCERTAQTLKQPAAVEDRSDNQLLHLGRAGDEKAFLALYHRRHGAVFRFALHMSSSREVAEEVVQEVFLALLADSTRYSEERGTLEAFLIGMARNQVRRQMRQTRRLDPMESRGTIEQPADLLREPSEVDALRKAILALPENYRAVTVLCELEELSYSEAAQRLGCAIGTVRSRLHRARGILEAKLRRRERCPISTAR